MVSDFLVAHYSGPFFALTHSEFQEAVKKYPNLATDDEDMYKTYSATAGIIIGQDAYFNNDTVLSQFERLFQLVEFKSEFKGHAVEVLVDNARTHSAKEFSVNDFGKGMGTRCPVDVIEYTDEGGRKMKIECFFSKGEHAGKSKGLLVLAQELKVDLPKKVTLNMLKDRLSKHRAFKNVTKLEQLAEKYGAKIIFAPKYHCETNPIEGLWCSLKRYVRTNSDQTFPTMLKLIDDARMDFRDKRLDLKLFRRFWRTLHAYKDGKSYADVLTYFFSSLCRSDVQSHRKISNTQLA